jgi:hypothetical protein
MSSFAAGWYPFPTVATSLLNRLLAASLIGACSLPAATWAQLAVQPAAAAPSDKDDADDAPAPPRKPAAMRGKPSFRWGVDGVRIEAGSWRDAPEASSGASVRAQPYLLWQASPQWELRLGVRLDGDWQRGGSASTNQSGADWGESYLRFRSEDTRISFGAQTIIWGRVDGVPVIDRVSRVDLRRFALDELSERRLPQWALRWEQGLGDVKLDAVWLPHHQVAELPAEGSVWHPVNRERAQIIGVEPLPALAGLFRVARLTEQEKGGGGAALRLTRTGQPFDMGLTFAHTRQPLPYFQLDAPNAQLMMLHPYTRFAAVDAEVVSGSATWRAELG